MKKIFFAALMVGFALQSSAQGFLDLKRYSVTRQFGTARSMGMGGAIGATGLDFSVSQINPAGLGQIRTGQAMFTTAFNFNGNSNTYQGHNVVDTRFNLSVPNMGVVVPTIMMERGKEKTEGLINYAFSFGFNRINDFNRNITIEGDNKQSSFLDYLAEQATKYVDWNSTANDFYPFFPEELALAANAIVHDTGNTYYANLPATVNMHQNYRYQQKGRQTDWNLSWGGNFSNRVYFGVGLGFPAIRYDATETITEKSNDPNVSPTMSFEQNTTVNTSGNGFNAKLGLTYKASDWLRLGVAYHSPTNYSLTDQFSYTFTSRNFTNGQFVYTSGELLSSDPGEFKYKFVTPGKTVLSAALIFKKMGMVALDYEHVNYTQAQSPTNELVFVNTLVRQNMQAANNFRVGGEYNYFDYRFRAGYAVYASPYKYSILNAIKDHNLALQVYSIGAGYQSPTSSLYFDAAVVYEQYDDIYTPYNLETGSRPYYTSSNTASSTRIVLTLGTKF